MCYGQFLFRANSESRFAHLGRLRGRFYLHAFSSPYGLRYHELWRYTVPAKC